MRGGSGDGIAPFGVIVVPPESEDAEGLVSSQRELALGQNRHQEEHFEKLALISGLS